MLTRRLEPEVMDTVEDAHDYDSMDHSTVNRVFADDLLMFAGECGWQARLVDAQRPLKVLDVGTGSGVVGALPQASSPRTEAATTEMPINLCTADMPILSVITRPSASDETRQPGPSGPHN